MICRILLMRMDARHCDFLGEHRLRFLVAAQKEDVMTFLKWILDNYSIKKFSSLHENWRLWCQLYRKAVGRSLHAKSCENINDVGYVSLFIPVLVANY